MGHEFGTGKFGNKIDLNSIGVGLKDSPLYRKLNNRVYFVTIPLLTVTNDDDFVMFDNINGRNYRPNVHKMVTRGLTILKLMEIFEQGYAILTSNKDEINNLINHINEYLGEFPRLRSIPNLNAYDTDLLNRLEKFGQEILKNQNNYLSNLEIKYDDTLSKMGLYNPNNDTIYKNVSIDMAPKETPYNDNSDNNEEIVLYSRFKRKDK